VRAPAISSTDVLFADSTQCEKNKRFLVTFCRLAKSYPLLGAEALALVTITSQNLRIPRRIRLQPQQTRLRKPPRRRRRPRIILRAQRPLRMPRQQTQRERSRQPNGDIARTR